MERFSGLGDGYVEFGGREGGECENADGLGKVGC